MALEVRGLAPLLQVYDMPRSLAFYRDGIGFEVDMTSGNGDDSDWVLLKLCGTEVMLNTAYERGMRPPAPDPARSAGHPDTCLYFGCPDVDAAYAWLAARGMEVTPPKLTSYGFKAIYLRDPDGYDLCFHWPAGDGDDRDG